MNWSWLVTLVCPLMMIIMMFGMRGGHGHGMHSRRQPKVEDLQQELNELKAQNEQMRADLNSIIS
ncbi:DUF2933 domain-containing protein [Paenibacillus sp. 22594]|uniref:DUF2933 domain-containing protein n=1 Tax=Paenibacillus sp. 22594 TaxID=3453947 RepID=UPI003F82D345